MRLRAALALALCALAAACGGGEDAVEPAPAAPPVATAPAAAAPIARNLIVVSLDTLRADRLGAYGCARPTSPAFDALAARGALCTRAISESSWTLPAHATLFTGLHPLRHGVLQKDHKLGQALVLLPEILAQQGFATCAFTGGGFVLPTRGFDQGFESFQAQMGSRVARKEGIGRWIAPALAAIDRAGGRRFFAFLHGYATHCPYTPPEPFAGTFHDPAAEPLALAGLCQEDFAKLAPTPGQVRSVADGYDDCVRWMDAELGELVAALERAGLMADTLLVVLSDHGEELSEHGTIGHGHALRPELLHVPLLFVGPGIAPARLDDDAALADVLPTVLELLGLDVPQGLDGASLAARRTRPRDAWPTRSSRPPRRARRSRPGSRATCTWCATARAARSSSSRSRPATTPRSTSRQSAPPRRRSWPRASRGAARSSLARRPSRPASRPPRSCAR